MDHRAISTLATVLGPRVSLGKSRLETLCLLVVGMVSARTVNLGHIACERPGGVLIASTYRRLQRFFQHVDLGADWTLPLVSEVLGLSGSWTLALDRTHWKIGRRDVNFLVLAVVTRRFRVPLLWSLLPGSGNSGTETRIDLMTRYLSRRNRPAAPRGPGVHRRWHYAYSGGPVIWRSDSDYRIGSIEYFKAYWKAYDDAGDPAKMPER